MTEELYKKHRPQSFNDVVGQESAVKTLVEMGKSGKIPHTILFTGPSGTGKTTLARILRLKLKCSDIDFVEVNAADTRGVDMVRDIRRQMGSAPLSGKCRVWLIDEVHATTSDAQSAFLKILEDTPSHVYFLLATTDPQKLKPTIRSRCTEIKCQSISETYLKGLINSTVEKEGLEPLDDDVVDRIIEVCDGGARKAMVILHSVLGQKTKQDQMLAIDANDIQSEAIQIARLLLNDKTSWKEVRELLSQKEMAAKIKEDYEGIRRMVLGYCKAVLLKSDKSRAADIIEEFRDHWFDIGDVGCVISCYNILRR